MAWPTTPGTVEDVGTFQSFGNEGDYTTTYTTGYDAGYADGFAAGGGGGPTIPTTGQTWPRGNP